MDKRELSMDEVCHILKEHKLWVDTNHQSGAQADFSNCDLRRFDFCYGKRGELYKFHSMNFRGTDFSGVSFERLHFKGCDFTDACMDQTRILEVCFEKCNFSRTKLSMARLSTSLMLDNSFYETQFGRSGFADCKFVENSFHGAYLDKIYIVKKSHIWDNQFFDMNPVYANFSNAEFVGNKFSHVTFMQCSFDDASFKKCHFLQSGFLDSYIERCRFSQSNLQDRFMQISFTTPKGDTFHAACDLGLRTVISRDLFDDKLPVRVDEFLKEALAIPARDKKQQELKRMLISIGKTFKEACASYRKDNQQTR